MGSHTGRLRHGVPKPHVVCGEQVFIGLAETSQLWGETNVQMELNFRALSALGNAVEKAMGEGGKGNDSGAYETSMLSESA